MHHFSMTKKLFLLILIVCSASLAACAMSNYSKKAQENKTHRVNKQPVFKDTPTLYFHGLMGSVKNEKPLVDAAEDKGITNSVIRANVDDAGKVKLIGKLTSKAKNPIIKVNFKNNVQPSFKENGIYASNVVKALQKKYRIRKVNMIGYSLGNMAIIHYVIQNGNKKKMPKLVKMVNLAGHFDGAYFKELPAEFRAPKDLRVDANGKPNKMNGTYQKMLKVRPIFQKYPVTCLNVIGDIGNGSDGVVEIDSARSLKYLVGKRNYHELMINADHGTIPNSKQVINKALKFLFK